MRKLVIILALLLAWPAQADRLYANSHPAERARGCTFADRFESQALVEKNGGAVTGTPTFNPKTGVTLDGAADYITYNLAGSEFDSDPISIVIEFTPDFNWDENAFRYLFDSTGGARYRVLKHNNAGGNNLSVFFNNTAIADIIPADYSAYWLVNQRNLLCISGTTGDIDAWLNGNAILVNDATAWTVGTPASLYIGANNVGANFFDGTIHSLKVIKAKLTAQEAQDYYDGTTFTYMQDATAIYMMRMQDHDPTNNRTLDGTGNGYHLTLGDGAGSDEPTKLGKHGYTTAVNTNYMIRASDGVFNPSGSFSIQCEIIPENVEIAFPVFGGIIAKVNIVTFQQEAYALYWSDDSIFFAVSDDGRGDLGHATTVGVSINNGQSYYITATYEYVGSGTSKMRLYVNDQDAGTNSARGPVWPSTEPIRAFLGAIGSIYSLSFHDGAILTKLQHLDFMIRAKARRNSL